MSESEELTTHPPRLEIQAVGSRVGKGRMSARDFAEIIRLTQQALKRVGQVLFGEESRGKGRKAKEIEESCELFMIQWRTGSAIATLELASPPQQQSLVGHIGGQSLDAFVNGMGLLDSEVPETNRPLPAGFDLGVLETIDSLGRVLDRGVETVCFQSINGRVSGKSVFGSRARERVQSLLSKPLAVDRASKVGRLEVLNGHGNLTGSLWEPSGVRVTCRFNDSHIGLLPEAWLRTVRITGKALPSEGAFEVDSLSLLDDPEGPETMEVPVHSFWESLSLEELIRMQQVKPASSIDEIASLWPADDNPDELLAFITEERDCRRRLQDA